jgi:membrane-bound metal-dependent hydrolase YbcI (DUF457 family)
MLLMCHLFIGLIIGLLAFQFLKKRSVVMVAAIGSILPDLIDKPLGHIILNGSLDYGRIYAHSGLFLICIVAIGLIYHHKKGSWILLLLAAGVFSHLALDSMWELPVTVFYPLLGDFGVHHFPNYVGDSLIMEFGSTYEWLFGFSCLAMILFVYRDRLGEHRTAIERTAPKAIMVLSLLLVATGVISLTFAAMTSYNPLSRDSSAESNLIIGSAAIISGYLAYRIARIFNAGSRDINNSIITSN